MNPFHTRALSDLLSPRRACVAALLAVTAIAAPAQARPIRICYMGSGWGVWVEISFDDILGNYDALAHAGSIDFTVTDGQDANDLLFTGVPGSNGLPVTLTGPADMVMGTFDVLGGLGTGTTDFALPNVWLRLGDWCWHMILDGGGTVPTASMQLTGFTADGEGVYEAHGLSIPVEFEVTRPDGSTFIDSRVCETMEFRSPLDLTPPCPADCDGNGILNIDDIDCFVAGFLGGCP